MDKEAIQTYYGSRVAEREDVYLKNEDVYKRQGDLRDADLPVSEGIPSGAGCSRADKYQ